MNPLSVNTLSLYLLILTLFIVVWIRGADNNVNYKYNDKYIGINGLDAGLTWTWYQANVFCHENFATTLATWTNNDDRSNAGYAQWSFTSNSTWIGVVSYRNNTKYHSTKGSHKNSGNTIDEIDRTPNEFICGVLDNTYHCNEKFSIKYNKCSFKSNYFICNAPKAEKKQSSSVNRNNKDGPIPDLKHEQSCHVGVCTSNKCDFDSSIKKFDNNGYYDLSQLCENKNQPTNSRHHNNNTLIKSAIINAPNGVDCIVKFEIGYLHNISVQTITRMAKSGTIEYVYINNTITQHISSITIYSNIVNHFTIHNHHNYKQKSTTRRRLLSFDPTFLPTSSPVMSSSQVPTTSPTFCNNNEIYIFIDDTQPVAKRVFINGDFDQHWPDDNGNRQWINAGFPNGYTFLQFNNTNNHWELLHFKQNGDLDEQLEYFISGNELPPNGISTWLNTFSPSTSYIGEYASLDFTKTECNCTFGTLQLTINQSSIITTGSTDPMDIDSNLTYDGEYVWNGLVNGYDSYQQTDSETGYVYDIELDGITYVIKYTPPGQLVQEFALIADTGNFLPEGYGLWSSTQSSFDTIGVNIVKCYNSISPTQFPSFEPTYPTAAPSNTPVLPPTTSPTIPPTTSPSVAPTACTDFVEIQVPNGFEQMNDFADFEGNYYEIARDSVGNRRWIAEIDELTPRDRVSMIYYNTDDNEWRIEHVDDVNYDSISPEPIYIRNNESDETFLPPEITQWQKYDAFENVDVTWINDNCECNAGEVTIYTCFENDAVLPSVAQLDDTYSFTNNKQNGFTVFRRIDSETRFEYEYCYDSNYPLTSGGVQTQMM